MNRILLCICSFLFVYSCVDANQKNIAMTAYYQGTQGQSQLYLYKDGLFEVHHSGVFLYSDTKKGTYSLDKDTLFLNSGSKSARFLSDTMIINNDDLYMVKGDSLIKSFFTLKPQNNSK